MEILDKLTTHDVDRVRIYYRDNKILSVKLIKDIKYLDFDDSEYIGREIDETGNISIYGPPYGIIHYIEKVINDNALEADNIFKEVVVNHKLSELLEDNSTEPKVDYSKYYRLTQAKPELYIFYKDNRIVRVDAINNNKWLCLNTSIYENYIIDINNNTPHDASWETIDNVKYISVLLEP